MSEEQPQRQLCTFFLNNMLFGIDVTDVQEVIRHQPITPVPLASKVVTGLINLRGQIVTALDLRARLGLPPRAADSEPMNVVVRRPEGVICLLVDEVGDVVDVDEANFEEPPSTMPASAQYLVLGAYKLDQQLLVFLDTGLATQTAVPPMKSANEFEGERL
jgi:purine-binding chemotaxis protein CheW